MTVRMESQQTEAVVESTSAIGITADQAGVAAGSLLRLVGFSVKESAATAAPATLVLRHGTLATDPPLITIELNANESAREWLYPGLQAKDGIFIDIVAGTIDIVLYHTRR